MTLKDRGGDAPVLECRSVERRFSGIVALNGIDMRIERGEIFGLVGPNGCGKTTLTNAITGFYPPQRGHILLNGRDITGLAPHYVATLGVARTFQNLALFNGMSVLDNILLGRHIHMKPSVGRTALYWWLARSDETLNRAAVEDVIDFLQLEGVRDELVDGIPIGLKKRVELARALAAEPKLLMLDEPTRGVDVGTIPHIHGEIRRLADEGKAVVVISSYLPEILAVSDRILVARTGRIVAEFDAADATQDKILYAAVH